MTRERITQRSHFGDLGRCQVVGRFHSDEFGSDGAGLLRRELASRTGLF